MQNLNDGAEIAFSPKGKISYFLANSVRPRSRDDVTRVLSGEKNGVPWLYLRVLVFGLILFAVNVVVYRLTQMAVSYITSIVLGGLVFNIALLVLFLELYPNNDINFLTLLIVTAVGGALTVALLSLGYEFIYNGDNASPWVSTIWTGFWEELVKALFAISAVLLLKKKDPLACFLIGIAVGTGYSIFEDISYIYSYSRADRVYWIVLMSIGRGLSCGFSHAPWTGVICFAFARFKKPFINFKFYLAFIICAVLHYLADVPFFAEEVMFLTGFNFGWLMEAVVVVSIVVIQYFILRKRPTAVEEEYVPAREQKLSVCANITAVSCALAICAVSLFGCAVRMPYVNEYKSFSDSAEFIEYVQDGLPLECDLNRRFGNENYAEYTVNGKLRYCTQVEEANGYTYYYIYGLYKEIIDEEEKEVIYLDGVAVKIIEEEEEKIYYLNRLSVYKDDYIIKVLRPYNYSPVPSEDAEMTNGNPSAELPNPEFTAYYFMINGFEVSYDLEEKLIKVCVDLVQTKHTALFIALGCAQGAILAGGATAFTILKIKSRRKTDAQR